MYEGMSPPQEFINQETLTTTEEAKEAEANFSPQFERGEILAQAGELFKAIKDLRKLLRDEVKGKPEEWSQEEAERVLDAIESSALWQGRGEILKAVGEGINEEEAAALEAMAAVLKEGNNFARLLKELLKINQQVLRAENVPASKQDTALAHLQAVTAITLGLSPTENPSSITEEQVNNLTREEMIAAIAAVLHDTVKYSGEATFLAEHELASAILAHEILATKIASQIAAAFPQIDQETLTSALKKVLGGAIIAHGYHEWPQHKASPSLDNLIPTESLMGIQQNVAITQKIHLLFGGVYFRPPRKEVENAGGIINDVAQRLNSADLIVGVVPSSLTKYVAEVQARIIEKYETMKAYVNSLLESVGHNLQAVALNTTEAVDNTGEGDPFPKEAVAPAIALIDQSLALYALINDKPITLGNKPEIREKLAELKANYEQLKKAATKDHNNWTAAHRTFATSFNDLLTLLAQQNLKLSDQTRRDLWRELKEQFPLPEI